ncbi:MAG: hypothetical protein WBN27_00335 [Eudoraea sp.]|uniref:hypothetical protein n=1 Tax=Eudoraea sp. TaxID=1979955 RepID=UPI003C7174EF
MKHSWIPLKEIGGIAGINKSISHHIARKTFASTVLLYNDVPMEIATEVQVHPKSNAGRA